MICENCKQQVKSLVIHKTELWCWSCHNGSNGVINRSTMINTDDIPGGLDVRHGICNPDGTPRRYYSKSEIKRAAYESGWTISGDTPNQNPRLVEKRAKEKEERESRKQREPIQRSSGRS